MSAKDDETTDDDDETTTVDEETTTDEDEETTTDDDDEEMTTTEEEEYEESIEEYVEMLEEAIDIFFDNLISGLTIHDALETDMALRASIACSYSLAQCIEEVEDLLSEGITVEEVRLLTLEDFEDAYEATAEILLWVEELAEETEVLIYAALDELYEDLEAGLTLTEALEDNDYLTYTIEFSSAFEDVLEDIYTAIEAGYSVTEAVALYEDDLETAVTAAAYLITDVAVQELEEEVQLLTMINSITEDVEALSEYWEEGYTLNESLEFDDDFEELYLEYTSLYEAVNTLYDYYVETGSMDEAWELVGEGFDTAITEMLEEMLEYTELLEEWEDLIDEAIEVLFENLNDGLTIYEALETDKALRAAIAVSADLGDAIQELTDMLEDGVSIDDAYELTEDDFDDSYAEAAAILIEMDELEGDIETILYAALEILWVDLETMTLTEALEVNADIYDACEMSVDFETVLDEIYAAIEEGYTVEEAVALYEDDLEDAVTSAAYIITDEAIQIIEAEVAAELFAEQIEITLEAIYASLAAGETLDEAIEENSSFEDYIEAFSELEDVLEEMYEAILDGVSIDDAVDLFNDELELAVSVAALAIEEEDEAISAEEELLAEAILNLFDNLDAGLSLYDALETDTQLRAAIAVSGDLGHAVSDLNDALLAGATISEAENLSADTFIDAYTEAATAIVYLEDLAEEYAEDLDAAIEEFYEEVEAGVTYTDAMEDNTDLEEAIAYNTDLETILIEFCDAIEDGETYTDALAEYEELIEEALDDAVYLIVDVYVQVIEDGVQAQLYEEGIEEALEVLYTDL